MGQKHTRHTLIFGGLIGVLIVLLVAQSTYYCFHTKFTEPSLPSPGLKELTAARGVELGLHVYPKDLASSIYTHIVTSQYSFITDDGDIHWDKVQPSPTSYNFTGMDALVDYATTHSMTVQAHHLIWNESDSLPKWLKNGHYSQAQLLDSMHLHISTIVSRYRGRVAEWTVVNEPFTRAKHMFGLNNWWGDHLGGGTDYIDKAFTWAHQADPNAKLLLNDFDNEVQNDTSDAQFAYMQAAKARGIPIDGIGMQLHVDAAHPPDKAAMIKNMQRFGAIGTPVYITEFDVNSTGVKGSDVYKKQVEAQVTNTVARACLESKSCVSFTVFGMTDFKKIISFTHTKTRSNLLTTDFQLKPAFFAFRDAWQKP